MHRPIRLLIIQTYYWA